MAKKIPYNQFEEYLNGTLGEVDLQNFEHQLKADEELKKELDLYKEIKKAHNNKELTEFEAKLKLAEHQYFTPSESTVKTLPTKSHRLWWLGAASIIGFLIMVGLKFSGFFETSPSSSQLFAQYAKHEFAFQEMNSDATLGELQSLLENNQYKTALPLLNTYLTKHPNAAEVKLANAIALLETQQYDRALSSFIALGNQHPLYQNESIWYQALTHLKQNQIPQCLSLLHQIPNDSSRYSESQQLISILEK